MPTVKDNLIAARKLIENEENWCRGFVGEKFCAVRAVRFASIKSHEKFDDQEDAEVEAVKLLADAMGVEPRTGPWVGKWNDTHTHAEVLAAFDRAIAESA